MDPILLINLAIHIFGIVVSGIGIVTVIMTSKVNGNLKKCFLPFFVVMLIYVLASMFAYLAQGTPGKTVEILLYICLFLDYLCPFLLVQIFSIFLFGMLRPKKAKLLYQLQIVGMVIFLLILLINQFSGLIYYLNEQNVAVRTSWRYLCYISPLIQLCIDAVTVYENRDIITGNELAGFCFFQFFPLPCILIQTYIPMVAIDVLSVVIAGLAIYVQIVRNQISIYYQQKVENARIKSNLLLAQMRPHFIFNSLMSIEDLCYSDPQAAAQCIEDFALYLRKNMESMSHADTVAFADEKKFIDEYIKLEKADPGRIFEVEYDLQEMDFRIPSLTLQPIVENAIIHGALSRNDEQGKIIISSRKEDNMIIIEVKDNGSLQVSQTEGQKKHWGMALENISHRLAYYCDGKISIASDENGTCVKITLPIKKDRSEKTADEDDHDR